MNHPLKVRSLCLQPASSWLRDELLDVLQVLEEELLELLELLDLLADLGQGSAGPQATASHSAGMALEGFGQGDVKRNSDSISGQPRRSTCMLVASRGY